jgi:hypothetical protein
MRVPHRLRDDHVQRLADRLRARPAEHRLGAVIPVDDAIVAIDGDECVTGRFRDEVGERFGVEADQGRRAVVGPAVTVREGNTLLEGHDRCTRPKV